MRWAVVVPVVDVMYFATVSTGGGSGGRVTSAMLEGRLTTPLDLRAQARARYVLSGVRPV